MLDQVGEDVAVEAVESGGVEGAFFEAADGVDGGVCGEVELGGYYYVELGEELLRFRFDVFGVDLEADSGVHGVYLFAGRLSSLESLLVAFGLAWSKRVGSTNILPDMLLRHEELRPQVLLRDNLIVDNGQ